MEKFSIIDDVQGYMSEAEIRFLCERVHGKGGVEIGCWFGRTTVNLLQHCSRLICIDHFQGTEALKGEVVKLASEGTSPKEIFIKNLKKYNYRNIPVKLLDISSQDAAKVIPRDAEFDFVFIDGDHSYEAVKKDILFWESILKKGGLLMGHDYKVNGGGSRPGVDKAVDELIPELSGTCGSIWFKYL